MTAQFAELQGGGDVRATRDARNKCFLMRDPVVTRSFLSANGRHELRRGGTDAVGFAAVRAALAAGEQRRSSGA